MNLYIVFSIIFLFGKSVTSVLTDSSNWSWTCQQKTGRCERVPIDQINSDERFASNPQSLNVCRLTCGHYGALWPVPTVSTSLGQRLVPFLPSAINFDLQDARSESLSYLKEMTAIFISNLEKECGSNCNIQSDTKVTVYISINSKDTTLGPDTNESYNLEISTQMSTIYVQIQADTVFGARHALETTTQLVAKYQEPYSDHTVANSGLLMVGSARIIDKPVYPHRGLLLDTARNYLPIRTIKKQIDGLAASKMNVLHWHATDSQSFPIESKRVPQLSRYGAYSSKQIYTFADIVAIIRYAKYRGVRVIMEIDAPSHAGNGWEWGPSAGLGNLAVCVNKNPWRQYCIQPPCGQLNPANPNVFTILGELYKEIVEVFPKEEYFHMGGDEVFIPCWNSTEEIVSYMQSKDLGRTTEDFLKLWSQYQVNSLEKYDNATGTSRTSMIVWSSHLTEPDVIEKYLPKNRYIIETWVPTTNDLPARLLEKGYRLIISTKNAWYFDHGFWGNTQYYTWRTVYKNRIPRDKGVLGGEVCMWGELVDEASVEPRVWPRAAAAAERLWSDPDTDTAAHLAGVVRMKENVCNINLITYLNILAMSKTNFK
ncbi:Hexosaminidase 2 [Carabus blaptoides fortunei]